ncbi:GlxA family transcriptional regulator [Paralimibaculum aggregatum]|uniref:GlxA family transcriptional regulator n=1 Tax=Paralimibaculum aggregatum TaxID=3036245 RepID=A0ABQ6LEZ9_9RHOB|nr:GlxA family transcriptional regulator [Limibaculum sp. NKW23]GMG81917.1 GlxA family transcriptional regulator [Limibaculum sp. NKW23]
MRPADRTLTTIAFLLVREFSMLSVVSALEPLRAANRLLGRRHYEWLLISDDGGPINASNGMVLAADGSLGDLGRDLVRTDFLFVCAGLDHDPPNRARLHSVLRQAARNRVILGSLSSGTFVLARAGLLEGYRCTVHWEFQPAFEEEFPELDCTSGLYAIDRDRWTGSGGITGLDMMLQLIERDHGPAMSRSVGNQFQIDRIRNSAVHQRPGALERLETLPAPIQEAIAVMLANVESPLKMSEIAAEVGVNLRRLERLFQSHLEMAPAQYYRRLRLEKARELLMHTNLSALEISVLTGFSSSSHFAMAYSRAFGVRPSATRRTDTNNEQDHDPKGGPET